MNDKVAESTLPFGYMRVYELPSSTRPLIVTANDIDFTKNVTIEGNDFRLYEMFNFKFDTCMFKSKLVTGQTLSNYETVASGLWASHVVMYEYDDGVSSCDTDVVYADSFPQRTCVTPLKGVEWRLRGEGYSKAYFDCIHDATYGDTVSVWVSEKTCAEAVWLDEPGYKAANGLCVNGVKATCDVQPSECFGIASGSGNACSGRGTCTGLNTCESCGSNYSGERCEEFVCHGKHRFDSEVCGGLGFCDDFNTCTCFDVVSVMGDAYRNPSGTECNDHLCGTFMAKETGSVCGGHGNCIFEFETANGDHKCDCDSGYSGLYCGDWKCYDTDHGAGTVCTNGNGVCSSPDVCTCGAGFGGDQCEIVCLTGCDECVDTVTCQKCASGKVYNTLGSPFACVDNCPVNTYNKAGKCDWCSDLNCDVCSSENTCTTCSTGYSLFDGMCYEDCGVHGAYLSEGGTCTKCSVANCLHCTSLSTCELCQGSKFVYNSNECVDDCTSKGDFYDNGFVCTACPAGGCVTCSGTEYGVDCSCDSTVFDCAAIANSDGVCSAGKCGCTGDYGWDAVNNDCTGCSGTLYGDDCSCDSAVFDCATITNSNGVCTTGKCGCTGNSAWDSTNKDCSACAGTFYGTDCSCSSTLFQCSTMANSNGVCTAGKCGCSGNYAWDSTENDCSGCSGNYYGTDCSCDSTVFDCSTVTNSDGVCTAGACGCTGTTTWSSTSKTCVEGGGGDEECDSGFFGADCSCTTDCTTLTNSDGTCLSAACVCTAHWEGTDCTTCPSGYDTATCSKEEKPTGIGALAEVLGLSNGATIGVIGGAAGGIVVVVLVLLAIVIVVIAVVARKRKKVKPVEEGEELKETTKEEK